MNHCIDDKPNGILLNHDSDWSGDVHLAWYSAEERRDPGLLPPSLRECWCSGPQLIAGRFMPLTPLPNGEPPIHVITRAVALAVEDYLHFKLMLAVEGVHIYRNKL